MIMPPAPRVFSEDRWVGVEFRKSYVRRIRDGFMARYLSGDHILDIGYQSDDPKAVPVTETAIGVGLDYPGYDGTHLPFPDASQDAVLASHVLEHIPNYQDTLAEWFRVLKPGGFLVLFLPHKHLYEKRPDIPSLFNPDHRRGYTSASLLREMDESLPLNCYRIRHLTENDAEYRYDLPFTGLPQGCYEIELVIEKIAGPAWSRDLEYEEPLRCMLDHYNKLIFGAIASIVRGCPADEMMRAFIGGSPWFPPWHHLRDHFVEHGAPELDLRRIQTDELKQSVRPLLDLVELDAACYVAMNPDLTTHHDPAGHWRAHGFFEGRPHRDFGLVARELKPRGPG